MKRLLACKPIVAAFDLLLCFPGLWCGFELGNIERILDLHSPEQIVHYIEHVYKIWDDITLGITKVREAVDIVTVLGVQQRAPLVNEADRRLITDKMDGGCLFSAIIDGHLRDTIKQMLLRLTVIVPTLKSLHENSKVLGIVTKAFKLHLLDARVRTTMYETLQSLWSSTDRFPVEVREGCFRETDIPEQDRPLLAFVHLVQSALRSFPYLTKCAPRVDPQQVIMDARVDPVYRFHFQNGAKLVGFASDKIRAGIEVVPGRAVAVGSGDSTPWHAYGESLQRRWGRPFTSAFQEFRDRLFLPNLFHPQAQESAGPSAAFVQQDLIRAFFPELLGLQARTPGILKELLAPGQRSQGILTCSLLAPPSLSLRSASPAREGDRGGDAILREEERRRRDNSVRDASAREDASTREIYKHFREEERCRRDNSVRDASAREETSIRETSSRDDTSAWEEQRYMREDASTREIHKHFREETSMRETSSRDDTAAWEEQRYMREDASIWDTRALEDASEREDSTFRAASARKETAVPEEGREENSLRAARGVDALPTAESGEGECEPNVWSDFPLQLFSPTVISAISTSVPLDQMSQQSGGFWGVCDPEHADDQFPSRQSAAASPELALTEMVHFEVPSPAIFSGVDRVSGQSFMECVEPSRECLELTPSTLSPTLSLAAPESRDPGSWQSFPTDSPQFSFACDLESLPSPLATPFGCGPSRCPSFLEQPTPDGGPLNHLSFISGRSESRSPALDLTATLTPAGQKHPPSVSSWTSHGGPAYEFDLYNGMWQIPRIEYDMERYLQSRPGWTMVVARGGSAKTLRPEHIIERMNQRDTGEKFVLIKPSCTDQFLRIHAKSKRADKKGDSQSAFVKTKRTKLMKY